MDFPKFVTVAELEAQVYLMPGQGDQAKLESLILAASDVINTYVQGNVRPPHAEGEPENDYYPRIKQATLMLAAEWFDNRETDTLGMEHGGPETGFLPKSIQGFLYPLRTPVVR